MSQADRLFDIADRQQGYFTAGQAKESGYYDTHFRRYVNSGEWTQHGRGVYRLARYPIADRPDLVEWSLWSRNKKGDLQGIWSHDTALDLYELCDIMPSKLHMTVPKHFRQRARLPPVLKLYFNDLNKIDWIERDGYRMTTLLRTLLDIAQTRQISDEFIKQAVIEGRRRGLLIKQQFDSLSPNDASRLLKRFYDQQ